MKSKILKISFSLIGLSLSAALVLPQANAQTTTQENRIKLPSEASTPKNENIITDPKLRAEVGSSSKYSMKFSFKYYGPPMGDLSNEKQPNPDGIVSQNQTAISGTISARYKINSLAAINLGTGVRAYTPLHGIKEYDVNNPFISYDMFTRFNNFQMRNSVGASYVTMDIYKKLGEYAGLDYDNTLIYNVPNSNVALELATSIDYYLFDREYIKADKKALRYQVGFYPYLKYNFSDKLNLNTSVGIVYWNTRQTQDQTLWQQKLMNQQVALGYAFSKTIYFSPYINFYPENPSLDSSTINFTTTFSLL